MPENIHDFNGTGRIILEFVDGNLKQNNCFVSYDNDNYFSGSINGNYWEGINTIEKFQFKGTFSGNPANRFVGTWKTTEGTDASGEMRGYREN